MDWSQFFTKILRVNFGKSFINNSNWEKKDTAIIKKIRFSNRGGHSLRGKKIIINKIILFKLWYIGQYICYCKAYQKRNSKDVDFSPDNPFFYFIPPRNISDKFTTIRYICRYFQPWQISSITCDKKLGFPTANHKGIYKVKKN